MSDGGDWNTEGDDNESTSVPAKVPPRPVVSGRDESLPQPGQKTSSSGGSDQEIERRLGRILSVLIVSLMLGMGAVFFLIPKTNPVQETHFVQVEDSPEDTARKALANERVALLETSERLVAGLIEAAAGDFNPIKRDILAVELLKLQAESNGQMISPEETLARAGAWERLLESPPTSSTIWYDIAMRTANFDRILATDAILTNKGVGTRALCFAGATDKALSLYQDEFRSALESADGIACGLNSTTSPLPFRGLTLLTDAVGVAASRKAVDLVDLFLTFRRKKSSTNSPLLMDLGAALYVEGKIRDQDILDVATSVQQECEGLPRGASGLSESVSPDVLLAAAKKLEASALPQTHKATAVENLYVAAALAGFLRLEDTRNGVVATTTRNERCLAQVEYQFEPEAALARLKRLESTEEPGGELQSLLALTEARLGHFDEAFAHTKKALVLQNPDRKMLTGRPSYAPTTWMLIAFAHRTGQLDQLYLINPTNDMRDLLQALRGDAEDLRAYRISDKAWGPKQTHTAVEFYLRGALAPGHEEAAIDGVVDTTSSVSHYQFSRAEAAAWLGDDESAKKWSTQREALHQRASGGKFGGHYLLWTR